MCMCVHERVCVCVCAWCVFIQGESVLLRYVSVCLCKCVSMFVCARALFAHTVRVNVYLQNMCLIGAHSTFVPRAHSMCLPLSVFVHYLQHFTVALLTYSSKFEFLVLPRSLLLDTMGDASSCKLFDWIRASIVSSLSVLPDFMEFDQTYYSCVQMLNNIRGSRTIESLALRCSLFYFVSV
jgi:hypothetical protein